MPRYIDAEKLCELARNNIDGTVDANDIMRFPTADVQEVRHGHWVREVTEIEDTYYFKAFCSVCNRRAVVKYKFCPHCGAKMDEEEQE